MPQSTILFKYYKSYIKVDFNLDFSCQYYFITKCCKSIFH